VEVTNLLRLEGGACFLFRRRDEAVRSFSLKSPHRHNKSPEYSKDTSWKHRSVLALCLGVSFCLFLCFCMSVLVCLAVGFITADVCLLIVNVGKRKRCRFLLFG